MIAAMLFPIALMAGGTCGIPEPKTAVEHLKAGECFARKEDWMRAEEHLRTYLHEVPESVRATALHVQALVHIGQPFDAVLEAEEFLKTSPDSAPVLKLYAGLQERVVKDPRKADEILQRLAKLTPGDAEVWRMLGKYAMSKELPEEAVRCYKKSVELDPEDPIAAAGLGSAYGRANQDAEAKAQFARAIRLNERRPGPLALVDLIYAQYLIEQDRAGESLEMSTQALALDPHSAMGYYWRAAAYERLGDHRHAEGDALASVREGGEKEKQVRLLLLRVYRAGGKNEAAEREAAIVTRLADAERAEQERAGDLRTILRQAEPLLREGKFAEAAPQYERIVRILPTFYEAYFALGVCYSQTSRPAEAEAAFRKFLSLQPVSVDGHAALGVLLANQNRAADAKKELEEALRLDTGQLEARRALAHLYMRESDFARAAGLLRPAVASPDADSGFRLMLAESLFRSGDKRGALEEIDRVLAAEPQNAAAAELKKQMIE